MERKMDAKTRNRLAMIASLKPESFVTVVLEGYEDLPEEFLPKFKLREMSKAARKVFFDNKSLDDDQILFVISDGENNGIIGWNENVFEKESLADQDVDPIAIPFSKENIGKLSRFAMLAIYRTLRNMLLGLPEENEGLESSPQSSPESSTRPADDAGIPKT